jgi:hypothetical protein
VAGNGLTWDKTVTSDGEIVRRKYKIKLDPNSETFLTVGSDGLKLSGIGEAISGTVSGAINNLQYANSGDT